MLLFIQVANTECMCCGVEGREAEREDEFRLVYSRVEVPPKRKRPGACSMYVWDAWEQSWVFKEQNTTVNGEQQCQKDKPGEAWRKRPGR